MYSRREISELIKQMVSQFSEDTYSDVHEMVRKKDSIVSSHFLVFFFSFHEDLNIELRLAMARGGSLTNWSTWIAGFVTMYPTISYATERDENN